MEREIDFSFLVLGNPDESGQGQYTTETITCSFPQVFAEDLDPDNVDSERDENAALWESAEQAMQGKLSRENRSFLRLVRYAAELKEEQDPAEQ